MSTKIIQIVKWPHQTQSVKVDTRVLRAYKIHKNHAAGRVADKWLSEKGDGEITLGDMLDTKGVVGLAGLWLNKDGTAKAVGGVA